MSPSGTRDATTSPEKYNLSNPIDRRRVLQAALGGGMAALAGCTGEDPVSTNTGGGGGGGDTNTSAGGGNDNSDKEILKVTLGNQLGGKLYGSDNILIEAVTMNVLLYNSLMTRDPKTGKLVPDAAKQYPESNKDGTSFTFDLREGMTFGDGNEVLAQDVKYSFEVMQEYDLGNATTFDYESIEVEDDYRFTYNTKNPFAPFVGYTSIYHSIIQEGTADKVNSFPEDLSNGPPKFAASGPFTLKEFKPQSVAKFEARDDYWKEGVPAVDEVHFEVIPEPSAQQIAIQKGNVHVLNDPLPKDYESMKKKDGIKGKRKTNPLSRMTIYLSHKPPFDNIHLRKALAYAINRKSIIENLQYGRGHTSSVPAPPDTWFYNEEADIYGDTPQKKKVQEHLEKAGKPDGFSFDLRVSNQGTMPDAAVIIQQNLKEVGIDVTINKVSPGSFYSPFGDKGYVAGLEYWNSTIYPGYYMTQLFTEFGNYWNWHRWGRYGDTKEPAQRMTDVLREARKSSKRDHRAPLLKEAQQIFADQAIFVLLGGIDVTKIWRGELENYDFVPTVWNNLRGVDIK